jgi:hypothetical protein
MVLKNLVVASAIALAATLGATSATLAQTYYVPSYGYGYGYVPGYNYSYGYVPGYGYDYVPGYGYGGYGSYHGWGYDSYYHGNHTGGPGGLGIGAQRG